MINSQRMALEAAYTIGVFPKLSREWMSDALRLLRRPETALVIVPGSSPARWLRVRGRQARC